MAAQRRGIPLESFPALFGSCSSRTRHSRGRRRHARQDHHHVAAGARAHDAGRDPTFLVGGVPLELPRSPGASATASSSSSRATSTTPPSSTRAPSSSTTARAPPSSRRRVRPRRHLPRRRRGTRAPSRSSSRSSRRTACSSPAPPRRGDWKWLASARCQVSTYGRPRLGADWTRGRRRARPAGAPPSTSRGAAERVSTRRHRPAGHYNVENPSASSPGCRALGARAPATSPGPCAASSASAAGRRFAAWRAGVTVIDDFAHHPTAVRETIAALLGPIRARR